MSPGGLDSASTNDFRSRDSGVMHYARALRRQLWLIVGVVVLAVAGALIATAVESKTYRASMSIVVGQGNGFFQPDFGGSIQPFTQTMTNLLESDIVARQVIAARGLNTTPTHLLDDLHVSTNPESSVLHVTYDSGNKQEAVATLNAVGTAFTTLVRQRLKPTPSAGAPAPITAKVFDPAHLEPGTVSPRPVRDALLAGLLGLIVGIALAVLRESLHERVYTRADAENWLRGPVIGTIPNLPPGAEAVARPPRSDRDHAAVDAMQVLRANLELSYLGRGATIAVTSALPEEGKTTIVGNLAMAMALAGANVICVDADGRQPTLAEYLHCRSVGAGLVNVLGKNAGAAEVLQDVRLPGAPAGGTSRSADGVGRLRVLPHGTSGADPGDVFRAKAVDELLDELKETADYVLIDAPSLLVGASAFPLAKAADAVVVVVRASRTTRKSAEAAAATLDDLGVTNCAVVLNTPGERRAGARAGRDVAVPYGEPGVSLRPQ